MRTHCIKIWPVYFSAVGDFTMRYQLRKNDRNYEVGDRLILQEWDPELKAYTLNVLERL